MSLLSEIAVTPNSNAATEYDLMRYLLEQLPPTEVVGKRWFTYNKVTGCWEDNVKEDYRHLALSIIHPTRRRVKTAHSVLDHLEDMIRHKLDFSGAIRGEGPGTVLINTRNRVLRVTADDIKEHEHDSDFRFTRSLEVDYAPGVEHELFTGQRLHMFSDIEDRDLFQMINANIFIPDARYEVFGVLYGEAGTGKDTIMAPVAAIFGRPERGLLTTFSINQISDPDSYALPLLQFAAVNICTELNSREVEDSSIFKAVVSGQQLTARMIYDRPFSMMTNCKLIFLSNNMPDFRFGTSAEGRRARFLRPDCKPTAVDVTVKQRLMEPHPGTLNWMLEGLQKLLRMGTQPMPQGGAGSREVHTRFTASNDPVKDFITAYCILDREAVSAKEQVKLAFSAYADDNNVSKRFGDNFFRMLYKRFPDVSPKRGGSDGERKQLIDGLKLNEAGNKLVADVAWSSATIHPLNSPTTPKTSGM